MIKDSKDFNEQLNTLKQGIKIPQLDVSKVMNSVEFNEYLNNIQVALNDLTQSTRILQDCNEYMVKYVNNVVNKKYKEFQQKLEYIEKNYSLYQNKNFISYLVKLNYEKEVRDRDNTIIGTIDYINQQNGSIDLFKNVSAEEAYSVEIDKEKGSCIIVFNKDTITKNNKKVFTQIQNNPKVEILNCLHRGISLSLIEGIKNSKYDFIARQDADDIWSPIHLELLLNEFDKIQLNTIDRVGAERDLKAISFEKISRAKKILEENGLDNIEIIKSLGELEEDKKIQINQELLDNMKQKRLYQEEEINKIFKKN